MDPEAGFVDPQDTLEMLRDALREGLDPENLTTTERTGVTAQAALQPFSYDVHVKLGMELMALRRQEANMRLDAEQFGEQLKRRAFVRDMLKRVAKEDNWVQYPASDLERISRALDRSGGSGTAGAGGAGGARGEVEEDPFGDDDGAKGKACEQGPASMYAKWLEQRRRGPARRTAFGTSVGRELKGVSKGTGTSVIDETASSAYRRHMLSQGGPRPDSSGPVVITTFGMAPRLMGPIVIHSRATSSPGSARAGANADQGSNDGTAAEGVAVQRCISYNEDGTIMEDPEGEAEADDDGGGGKALGVVDAEAFAVRFASDDDDNDEGRWDLQEAAELLGLGGKDMRRSGGMLGRTQSELLAAASYAVGSSENSASGGPRPDWRAALRKNRAAAADASAAAAETPIMKLQMSIRRGRSMTAAAAAAAMAEADAAPTELPVPEVAAPLSALEAAVQAVEALGDEQLRAFVLAVEAAAAAAEKAEKAAAAAEAGAPPSEATSAAAAAKSAAGRQAMYGEAAAAAELWVAAAAQRLEDARDEYGNAHEAKLDSISSIADLTRQLQLLREWCAGQENKRLTAAAASLAAQRERLEAAAAAVPGGGRSPALARLLDNCGAAVGELDAMVAAVAEAEAEAAAQLAEREHRRAALRLIEDECVQLAEEMAAREETDRLVDIMAAEAEAERRMAGAKDEDEARHHALVAAMLMGQEEWVLEREVRLAALRAAARDEKRLSALLAAEEDKARVAGAQGRAYDSGLLQELVELEQAAKREVALRRERLEEAISELSHFDEMLRQQQERQAREDIAVQTVITEAAESAIGCAAAEAEAAMEPPSPAAPEPQVLEAAAAAVAEMNPAALVIAAVEAVRECFSVAAAEVVSEPQDAGAAAEAEAKGDADADADADGEGAAEGTVEEEALERYSRAAQARLAAARSALEAVQALIRMQRQAAGVAGAAGAEAEAAVGLVNLDEVREAVREEQQRLAALVASPGTMTRTRGRALLLGLIDSCDGLAALMASVAEEEARSVASAPAPAASVAETTPPEAATEQQVLAAPPPAVQPPAPEEVVLASPSAAPPPSQPPMPPPQPLQLMQASLPQPTSPSGALAPPVVRSRPSPPGAAATVMIGFGPGSESPADWRRSDPLSTTASTSVSTRQAHPAAAGSIATAASLPNSHAHMPSPFPLPNQHQPGAAAAAGARAGQQAKTHHHAGGIVAPYGSGGGGGGSVAVAAYAAAQPLFLSPTVQQLTLPVVADATPTGPRRSYMLSRPGATSTEHLPPIGGSNSPAGAQAGMSQSPTAAVPAAAVATMAAQLLYGSDSTASGGAEVSPWAVGGAGAAPSAQPSQPLQKPPQHQPHPPPPPPQQQQQQQQAPSSSQQISLQMQWTGVTVEPRHAQSLPVSPEPSSGAVAAPRTAGAGAGGPSNGTGSTSYGARQAWPLNSHVLAAPLAAPNPNAYDSHSHVLRRQGQGPGGGSGGGDDTPGSGDSSGGGGSTPTALRGLMQQQPQRAGAPGLYTMGDMSYTQWVSSQHDVTPKALEAARQVDEMLSRLPPELHSVLLNAAELLTLGGGGGAAEALQAQPLMAAILAGADAAAGSGGGSAAAAGVPAYLQGLPPSVSKYIHAQLQRIYNSGGGGAKYGRLDLNGGGGGAAVGFSIEQSVVAMELLNQMLPMLAQGVAQVRTRMGGSGGGGGGGGSGSGALSSSVPSSVSFEASRSPVGSGALQGSPLRSSRKTRSVNDVDSGGSSGSMFAVGATATAATAAVAAVAVPSPPQQPRLRHQTLSLSTQNHHVAPSGGNRTANGSRRTKVGAAGRVGFGKGASLPDQDQLRRQHDSLSADRWMVRGVNMQPVAKPTVPPPRHSHDGLGLTAQPSGGGGRGGVVSQREAFLPPLGNKLTTVRH